MGKPSRTFLKSQRAASGHAIVPVREDSVPLGLDIPMDTPLARRKFIRMGGKAIAFLAFYQALQRGDSAVARHIDHNPFTYGVASGDPLHDRVIIWTRVNPSADAIPGSGVGRPVTGLWEIAHDAAFRRLVRVRPFLATRHTDHTVKIDVTGLAPDTEYYFRFRAFGVMSPVGRTRTAPAPVARPESVRFGMVSCSNFEAGFFTAYRELAQRDDLDFILHLGDYIYEYANGEYGPEGFAGEVRAHDPAGEIFSLGDYRRRHACYKTDPDLQALHARHPFICTWDDHETANNAWADGAENHTEGEEGEWAKRKADGIRAYFEWMPVREQRRTREEGEVRRIYRRFSFGRLMDLFMLDLRQYRSEQPASPLDSAAINDPSRTIAGDIQMEWLRDELATSEAQWKFCGNSVQIAPVILVPALVPAQLKPLLAVFGLPADLAVPTPTNVDSWDGYAADRQAVLATVAGADTGRPVDNVVFLTGDIHSTWACDVPANPAAYHPLNQNNSIATEFVVTSVTSDNVNDIIGAPERIPDGTGGLVRNPVTPGVEQLLQAFNPWVRALELDSHGFCVVDVTSARTQVDYWFVRSAANPLDPRIDNAASVQHFASYQTSDLNPRVTPAPAPVGPRGR
jgi:alkaline phosphatase D